jgi:hypothetical protein
MDFEKLRVQRQKDLKKIIDSPRSTGVYVVARDRACPVCRSLQGTYAKTAENIPALPVDGCACVGGCDCRYEPLLVEVGP